jgi:hypothetical protein
MESQDAAPRLPRQCENPRIMDERQVRLAESRDGRVEILDFDGKGESIRVGLVAGSHIVLAR